MYVYEYFICMCDCTTEEGIKQKKASDPIIGSFEPPCGCWDLNSGPLEDQAVLLTAESSLQHHQKTP